VPPHYSELQLDALRELANIGSGTASTALSSMIGRSVDVSIPSAEVLSLADAVDAAGPPEATVTAVVMPIVGDLDALVMMIFHESDVEGLCPLLGVEPHTEVGLSALGEIGNILGTSYVGALSQMTGIEFEPRPPQTATDMLAAIVASVLAAGAGGGDVALLLDSNLIVEGEECSLSFMLVPTEGGVNELLVRLGVGG
jgi:chemotaxis protein CheC